MTVRRAASLAFLLLLAFCVRPELPRYRAERRLRAATDAFRAVMANPSAPDALAALDSIADSAREAGRALPHDPRPFVLGGSARLVARRPDAALELYRRALATGERAEIDLNLGRTLAWKNDSAAASAALLRALWVSPVLASSLPPATAKEVLERVAILERRLRAGRMKAPPPAPE